MGWIGTYRGGFIAGLVDGLHGQIAGHADLVGAERLVEGVHAAVDHGHDHVLVRVPWVLDARRLDVLPFADGLDVGVPLLDRARLCLIVGRVRVRCLLGRVLDRGC